VHRDLVDENATGNNAIPSENFNWVQVLVHFRQFALPEQFTFLGSGCLNPSEEDIQFFTSRTLSI
jgi:hypothetical protein